MTNMRVKSRSLQMINSTLPGTMFRSAPQPVVESAKPETEFETVRELRLKLEHSLQENNKLQNVIADLTQVNKRWQKYNSDRQIYVQKLLNTIQDQQEQLNHISERSFNTPAAQSSTPTSNGSDAEVERLRTVEKKLKEKVSILEFQVKAHRDDWEAELNEKKQAMKDKEAVERKLAELLTDVPGLSVSGECGETRVELYCQNCGRMMEFDQTMPSRNRMYRTAVHLPCSSSRHSSSTSISTTGDELVIDSKGTKLPESNADTQLSRESTKVWNIKADETSYSRSSTVPLVSGPTIQSSPSYCATTTHSSASSISDKTFQLGCNPVTVKSFVQIPIVKSSSVPEGSASKFPELPRMSLDSLKYSTNVPPVSIINSAEQYDGVDTMSAENVICLRCGEVFPPEMHLKFLDHFPKCQSNRKHEVSRDGAPKF